MVVKKKKLKIKVNTLYIYPVTGYNRMYINAKTDNQFFQTAFNDWLVSQLPVGA